MRLLIVFAILVCFVSLSQQQRRRTNVQVIRNFDDNDLVQRYEETPPIRAVRKQVPTRPQSRPARPSTRTQVQLAPKVERKFFNVLLRTATGFDETAGYSLNG